MSEETPIAVRSDTTHVHPRPPAPELHALPHPSGDGGVFVYAHGYTVQSLPGPRCHRREHVFHDVRSFAAYLKQHVTDTPGSAGGVEILVDECAVVAALDPDRVMGDRITCQLVEDCRYEAWTEALEGSLSQREFLQLMRAQRKDLDPRVADAVLGALKNLTITGGREIKIQLDETGYTRFAADTGDKKISGEIPPSFIVTMPVFEGIRDSEDIEIQYDVEVFVSMDAENGVTFALEAPTLSAIVRHARRDAAAYLTRLLDGTELLVGLGKFAVTEGPSSQRTKP